MAKVIVDLDEEMHRMTQLRAYTARDLAQRKLAEMEAWIDAERQRRGLAPVTNDSGKIIGWTRTRPQYPGGR